MERYSVSLEKFVKNLSLNIVYAPAEPSDIYLTSKDVQRPGLILAGYSGFFMPDRIQFLGLAELGYVAGLPKNEGHMALERFFSARPSTAVVSHGQEITDELCELAKKYQVSLLSTDDSTSSIMAATISFLSVELAPRITRHGVLVEVSGEGVLILGDSGIGKSECALELMKRGHRLIADDAVEIRQVSRKTVVGSAPDNIRHFIELHGVGIVDARRIFGMGAIKMTEKIDMVIQLVQWEKNKVYERLGLVDNYTTILGVEVPIYVVPVKPGRNLSIIIEAAAMNNRQKKMGYDAAQELIHQLGLNDDIIPESQKIEVWEDYQ